MYKIIKEIEEDMMEYRSKERNKNITVRIGDLYIPFSAMDRSNRKSTRKQWL